MTSRDQFPWNTKNKNKNARAKSGRYFIPRNDIAQNHVS